MLQITNIVDLCVKEYDNKIRVGFVGYRDHCDGSDRIASIDLTEDTSKVNNSLRQQEVLLCRKNFWVYFLHKVLISGKKNEFFFDRL